MTLGRKITNLRSLSGISQESLAEKLSVSRQSVSKWETGQSLPKMETLVSICKIFGISIDEFLREDVMLPASGDKTAGGEKHRYFGTDGFRGEVSAVLNSDHAYKVGRFLGWYYASPLSGCRKLSYKPRIVIGKDTRRSSYTLEYALAAGLTASGADAYMLHVTTTPSVSFVTRHDEFDCGIMITASHNPFFDNGIKIINRYGEKIDDGTISLLESYIDGDLSRLGILSEDLPMASRDDIGCIIDYVAGRNRYVGYLISLASHSYRDLRIGLDCANGSSWMIARAVFDALGAQTFIIGASPDGTNINRDCGSTHIESLRVLVKGKKLDVGFAFDGDADRCIAVDENGDAVDGDKILYILACRLRDRGMLEQDTVAMTVMSNSALDRALEKIGIRTVRTDVGDRFVYERMLKDGLRLGGEQSGHIIMKKHATTGDGILTAIMIAEEMKDRKSSLSALAQPVTLYPQLTKSIKVTNRQAAMNDAVVLKATSEVNEKINGNGRILLRESGTEPVVRIMVECPDPAKCEEYVNSVASVIRKRGYCFD